MKTLTPERQMHKSGYRSLNPHLGRWCSRDPIEEEGGINLYLAMLNRATDIIDPVGAATTTCGPVTWGSAWQKRAWFRDPWIGHPMCQCYAKQTGTQKCKTRYGKKCCITLRWKKGDRSGSEAIFIGQCVTPPNGTEVCLTDMTIETIRAFRDAWAALYGLPSTSVGYELGCVIEKTKKKFRCFKKWKKPDRSPSVRTEAGCRDACRRWIPTPGTSPKVDCDDIKGDPV